MHKSKVLLFGVLFLLILQPFVPNAGLLANAENTANDVSTNAEVKVDMLSQQADTINWQVTIETSGESDKAAQTEISFSNGQSHGTVKNNASEVKVEKAAKGYSVESPAGNHTYKIDVSTKIADDTLSTASLEAKIEYDGKKSQDVTQAQIDSVSPAEEETVEPKEVEETATNNEPKQKEEQSKAEEKVTNKKSTEKNEVEEPVKEAEQVEEEASSYEKVLAILHSKPLEEFTEAEIRKLMEGLSEADLQRLEAEFNVEEEIGVHDPNFKPFIRNSQNMFRTMSSNPLWPAPGSVNLHGKDATSTSNPYEWEIELSVEAKDLQTSSDIVLVLDRSGSMSGNRLTQAKAAAKQFVNTLLTENSNTRIALVTFGENSQENSNFQGPGGKQSLITAIDNISASGGTNIQAGLREANNLVAPTTADMKTIVLLSDGEPTYSYRASSATSHSFTNTGYNFKLSGTGTTRIGNGSSYNLPTGFFGIGDERYTVNGYTVRTNGSATVSEALTTMNNGKDIYSIGLGVGANSNAEKVLKDSQNKGYHTGSGSQLDPIFQEIASALKYAATDAVVTDPIGEMFDLVKGQYSGADFNASHGTVSWDEATETFTWNIGDIKEGEKPTLKYTVTIDWEHPDLKGHVDYPMNKTTPLNYTDLNGNPATKHFEIPEGQIDKGKIKKYGYRVNVDGDPVDSNGNIVGSIEEAEKFYDEYFGNFHDYGTYDVPAKAVPDYTLFVGDDPISVTIGPENPVGTAYFGYVKTSEMPAADVIAKYWDEDGNTLVPDEEHSGNIGDAYTTEQKVIPGYEFVEMHEDSDDPTGTFTHDEQTVIYVYKKLTGTIKVIKVDEEDQEIKLPEAKFNVLDGNDEVVAALETNSTGEATTGQLPVGDYTIEEVEAPTGYEISTTDLSVEVKAGEATEKIIKNRKLKGSLTVFKKDVDGDGLLPGATFELHDANDEIVGTALTTGAEGKIVFPNLEWGTYTLVETKAPEGYNLLGQEITVEITKDKLHVEKIVDNSLIGWEIPKTGGIGTLGFYLSGLLFMIIAAWLVIRRRIV